MQDILQEDAVLPGSPRSLGYEILAVSVFVVIYGFLHLVSERLGLAADDPLRVRLLFTPFVVANVLATYIAVAGLKLIPARGLLYDVGWMITFGLLLCTVANAGDLLLWLLASIPLKSLPYANALFICAIFLGAFGLSKLARLCHVQIGGLSSALFIGFCTILVGAAWAVHPDVATVGRLTVASLKEAIFGLLYSFCTAAVAVIAFQIWLEAHGQVKLAARMISLGVIFLSLGCFVYGLLFTMFDPMTVASHSVHLILGISYLSLGLGVFRLGQATLEAFTPDFATIPLSQPLTETFGQSLGMKLYEAMTKHIRTSQEALDKADMEKRIRDEFIANLESEIAARKQSEEDLRRAKEEAEAANQAKSQFLAMITHELRTPLVTIRGYGQLLADPLLPLEHTPEIDPREFGRRITASAVRLQALIDAILHFSRSEAGHINVQLESCNLDSIIESVCEHISVQARMAGIAFTLVRPQEKITIWSDAQALTIILWNLLGNALKFTAAGEIRLEVACRGSELECVVSDTGIGIPADLHDRVFEPFVQLSDGTKRRFGGVGLGLNITKRFLEALNGKISLTSEPGRGTSVRFTLPLRMPLCEPAEQNDSAHKIPVLMSTRRKSSYP